MTVSYWLLSVLCKIVTALMSALVCWSTNTVYFVSRETFFPIGFVSRFPIGNFTGVRYVSRET